MKSIAALTAVLFLFLGSVGVSVFSHICEEDGVNVSYFVPDEEVCGGHSHEEHTSAQEACPIEDNCCCDEEESSGCCSTSTELVKVDLDYFHNSLNKAIFIPTESIALIWKVEEIIVLPNVFCASGSDPPPKLGKELLIANQQWLI